MKKIIIIPAYNEAGNIENTINDILNHANSFDYVIINDCSVDNTEQICIDNNFNYITLPVNLGIGGAVQTGYMYAWRNGYDIAVQFDGDGQHNAKYLDQMYDSLIENKIDMIIGSRFIENKGFQSSFVRRIGIKYFTYFIKLLTLKTITDPTSGMRMVNKRVIHEFINDYPKDYPEPESCVNLLSKKYKVKEVAVEMNDRISGVSSISPIKSVYYMFKVSLAVMFARIKK